VISILTADKPQIPRST